MAFRFKSSVLRKCLLFCLRLAMRKATKSRKTADSAAKRALQRERKSHLLPAHSPEAFKAVAALIISDPPAWLVEHLWQWSSAIYLGDGVELRQPTRTEMRNILGKVSEAAGLLQRALAEPSVCEFLDAGGDEPLNAPVKLQILLGEIKRRADRASERTNLVNEKGKGKPGRGRAQVDEVISTRVFCSILFAEAWNYVRGEFPAPHNLKAAQALELYWNLCGCERDSWGDEPQNAWRDHLATAARTPAERERAEFRRHMHELSRHANSLQPDAARGDGN
jgi:hypothetical protein